VASLNKEEDYSVFEVWIFLRSFKKKEKKNSWSIGAEDYDI